MSKAARFDIFYQGRLYRKNLTAAEITKEFGCKSAMVYQAANTGHKINRVFEVKKIYPENEKNLEWFLKDHPDFTAEDISEFLPEGWDTETAKKGYLTLLPHKTGTDGFFISKLRRKD